MRKTAWGPLLLVAAVLSGCQLDWPLLKHQQPPKASEQAGAKKPVPPPVVADQVTEENARDVAQALEDEIARDEQTTAPGRGAKSK